LSRLTILTFGGFEVRREDRRLADFESWRTRALAAFLITHRGQAFSRDRLANLLWPEIDAETARRNLRQALYNLRSTLESPDAPPRVTTDGGSVRFELRDGWLDLEAFEAALATRPGDGEPTALAEAVRLYRGDFLSGLRVGESLELEEWLIQEQERLREAVVASLRALVDHYLGTGGYSAGVYYARRLLALDPLSEETHRKLMRLYALSGRRSRALSQYQELREVLARELDVEPLAETEALYREMRAGTVAIPAAPLPVDPVGPVVPLVGRNREMARLREAWQAVARGRGRITLIEGEEGVGKTRLIRAALHRLGVGERATVLMGRHFRDEPGAALSGLRQALEGAVGNEAEATARLLDEASDDDLRVLARVSGRLRELAPRLRPEGEASTPPGPEELAGTLSRTLPLLGRSIRPGAASGPTVLYLDDVDGADAASLAALTELARRLERSPVWLLLSSNAPADGEATGELSELRALADRIDLLALDRPALEEVAVALVGKGAAGELAELLAQRCGGHPLLCSELVNLLWDRGVLAPRASGWALTRPLAEAVAELPAVSVDEVIRARFRELPPSARRLVALAAVAGPRFDVPTLCAVEGEDERVVETTLRLLLERWWLRLHLSYWADSRRDRDLTLYTGHGRGSTFEFGHERVRRAILGLLAPDRRSSLRERVSSLVPERAGGPARADRPAG
jgi:DNA-binding SARP family transcriptional activator